MARLRGSMIRWRWSPWEIVLGVPIRRKPNIVKQLKKKERFR